MNIRELRIISLISVSALILLGACADAPTPTPVPVMPTATDAPTNVVSTLPPAWTSSPTPDPNATHTPTPTLAPGEPTYTPVIPTVTPQPRATLNPACVNFSTDQGTAETVSHEDGLALNWAAVEGATSYVITVRAGEQDYVFHTEQIVENVRVFEPDFFILHQTVYGWEVWPINAAGDQMCFSISGEVWNP